MPTTITGNSATDPGTTPSVSGPAFGDAVASGPIDTFLQTIMNALSWLRVNSPQLGGANAFAGSNTFNAAVTIAGLLSLNSGNVQLTAAGLQSILKTGTGKLDIGTLSAQDLEFLVGNVVKWTLQQSSGNLVSAGGTVSGLPAPAVAGQAAVYPVNRPQLAAVGQQVSLSCGVFITTSTALVDVTNLSVALTTSGRPVMVMLQSDGAAVPGGYINGTAGVTLQIQRGATIVQNIQVSANISIPQCIAALDVVGAGTYTYKVQALNNAAGSLTVSKAVLVAYEI